MNGRTVIMQVMECKACDISIKFNAESNVSFVDSHRAFRKRCKCKQNMEE